MSKNPSENLQLIFQDMDFSNSDTFLYSTRNTSNWINVSRFHKVMAVIFRTVGTGKVQNARLMAASTVTGTGATAVSTLGSSVSAGGLLNVAAGSNANNGSLGSAGAGMVVLEATSKDLDSTLADADFVQVQVSPATGTDEFGVLFVLSDPRYGEGGLTATGTA
jgi:hypothetical protein